MTCAKRLLNLVASVVIRQIARRLPPGDPDRWFWRAASVCQASSAVGFATQLAQTRHGGGAALTPLVNGITGFGLLAVIVAMIAYPLPPGPRTDRLRPSLDLATFVVCAGAFSWYGAEHRGRGLGLGLLDLLSGPVVTLVTAFAVGKLLVFGRVPFSRLSGVLYALACVSSGAGGARTASCPTSPSPPRTRRWSSRSPCVVWTTRRGYWSARRCSAPRWS